MIKAINQYIAIMAMSVIVSACSSVTISENVSQQKPKPTLVEGDLSQWQYVDALSDEFNTKEVNLSKWQNNVTSWGPWSWSANNVVQQNGVLNIKLTYQPHKTTRFSYKNGRRKVDVNLFYKSGILRSKAHLTYGYYEAKIKGIPTFPGSSPAFWIYSLNDEIQQMGLKGSKEGEVTYSEVDVVELQQAEWDKKTKSNDGANVIDMNLHTRVIENGVEIWKRPGKYPQLTRNKIHANFDARDDFHIYGAEVSPEKVIWYIDGVKVAEKPNQDWHLPMHVTLSLGLRYPHVTYNNCPNGLVRCAVPEQATADGYPSAMQVDWVRVYKKRN